MYKHLCNSVKSCVENAKSNFYNSTITNSHENKKTLFSIVSSLLDMDNRSRIKLPLLTEDISLAEKFSDYFVSKIVMIRDSVSHLFSSISALTCPPVDSIMKCTNKKLDTFKPASNNEISKILMKVSKATCSLDPIHTRFLIYILLEILPMLVLIVNLSISSGLFSDALKSAIVKPLLKKSTLNPDC